MFVTNYTPVTTHFRSGIYVARLSSPAAMKIQHTAVQPLDVGALLSGAAREVPGCPGLGRGGLAED